MTLERSVAHGDEIYYQTNDGPRSGRVTAVGQHGVQVEHESGSDRVLHEHVLGHKSRAKRNLKLVEHGEDGYIATDDEGRRVYVAGRLPEPMQKAESPQVEMDIALMRAGFVPDVEYIRKSYGAHWQMPGGHSELVDELRAQVMEVSRSTAETAQALMKAVTELGKKLEKP